LAESSLQSEEQTNALLSTSSKSGSVELVDEDGDSHMDSGDESDTTTTAEKPSTSTSASSSGSTSASKTGTIASGSNNAHSATSPIPPNFTSIGSPDVPTHQELRRLANSTSNEEPQPQLKSQPGGDAYPNTAKVEGLMDTSESPLKM
jgi:protein phosphatase 2C family protein 2/3